MSSFFAELLSQIHGTNMLELFAAVLGVLSVWFAKKENILVYPVGIVSTAIYVYLLFKGGLYAVSGINLYYTLISCYGWYKWSKKDENNDRLKITYNNIRQNFVWLIITFVLFCGIFLLLRAVSKTQGNVLPTIFDALTSSIFASAMILQAKKKVETWMYWIVGDVISVPFYMMTGFYFTGVQYMVFLVIAAFALAEWMRKAKENTLNDPC